MNVAYEEKYTVEDYERWEGDWELIYGDAYAMSPSPTYSHQRVSGKIFRQLDERLDSCSRCSAIFETDLEFSSDTVIRPDTMIVFDQHEEKIAKIPEIIFEVISTNAKRDEILKFELYENEAVPYYAMVYPQHKKVKLYQLIDGKYRKVDDFSQETYTFDIKHCSIDFGFIWNI
jgi:Uma2 family endonuclease